MFWVAILPFAVFVGLLFAEKSDLLKTALISAGATIVLGVLAWKMPVSLAAAASLKGLFVATDILLIVWGALYFLKVLENNKTIDKLCRMLEAVSTDYRVLTILLGWFLEGFLEGTAGFGTPLAVVAPILVGLGIKPMTAIVATLVANSTAGMFGAAGTPIRVGMAAVNTAGVPELGARMNLIGIIIPLAMIWIVTRGRKEANKEFWEIVPFALFSGVAFTVGSLAFVGLGQEFPTILGALASGAVSIFALKWLKPKKDIRLNNTSYEKNPKWNEAVGPYLLLVALLVAGKIILGNGGFTLNFGVAHKFAWFNPGSLFILAGLVISAKHKYPIKKAISDLIQALGKSVNSFLVIGAMSALVQVMNFSGMMATLAMEIKSGLLPIFAPIIGAFGAFLTGSVTVSNIMFSKVLADSAAAAGLPIVSILALQVTGAVAGNMIALADVLPAETVLGMRGKEKEVILKVLPWCVAYVLLAIIAGMIFLPKQF